MLKGQKKTRKYCEQRYKKFNIFMSIGNPSEKCVCLNIFKIDQIMSLTSFDLKPNVDAIEFDRNYQINTDQIN